jgi:hypothetical protein
LESPILSSNEDFDLLTFRLQVQNRIKEGLKVILQKEGQKQIRKKIGDTLSALAVSVLTLKDNSWPDLFPYLLEMAKGENEDLRCTAMDVFWFAMIVSSNRHTFPQT